MQNDKVEEKNNYAHKVKLVHEIQVLISINQSINHNF